MKDSALNVDIRPELKKELRVFYVTSWGYAADHLMGWYEKSLNSHREIYTLMAHEGSRPKYMKERLRNERPDVIAFTQFLNDMGMRYKAIGDCYSYRAHQLVVLRNDPRFSKVPMVNILSHPVPWLEFYIRWRKGNMRMPKGGSHPMEHEWRTARHALFHSLGLKKYEKQDTKVWTAFQGMFQLNAILSDLKAFKQHITIEAISRQPKLFKDLAKFLTKDKVIFTQAELDHAYAMLPTVFDGEEAIDRDPKNQVETWPGWKVDAFRKLVKREAVDAYRKFGYDLFDLDKGKLFAVGAPPPANSDTIFVSSLFKSGTWFLREIIQQITGRSFYEPTVTEGTLPDYSDHTVIDFPVGTFFSWHSVLTKNVRAVLKGVGSKNFFMVRNLYSIILAVHHHLTQDVDAGIGRSIGKSTIFDDKTTDEILCLLITGFQSKGLNWHGMRPIIVQLNSFVEASVNGEGNFLTYESFQENKPRRILEISQVLGFQQTPDSLKQIVDNTSMEIMRAKAKEIGAEGHIRGDEKRLSYDAFRMVHVHMLNGLINDVNPNIYAMLAKYNLSYLIQLPVAT